MQCGGESGGVEAWQYSGEVAVRAYQVHAVLGGSQRSSHRPGRVDGGQGVAGDRNAVTGYKSRRALTEYYESSAKQLA